MSSLSLHLHAIPGIPLIGAGDDLAAIIFTASRKAGHELLDGDILVVAQKIISKSEGRLVNLDSVTAGEEALRLATLVEKDPRLVELILRESSEVVRHKPGVIIVRHRSGIVLANAGIDHSNIEQPGNGYWVSLLPEDSNRSAGQLRRSLEKLSGRTLGLIITDSVGRAWRRGTVGIALGSSGVTPLRDLRGDRDLFGEELRVSETADADAIAGAAGLLMGEASEASPVVIVRGAALATDDADTGVLIRPESEDLFR